MMNELTNTEEMVKAVAEALRTVAPDVATVDAQTPLTGDAAVIDSVGLVSLLVTLEDSLQKRLQHHTHDARTEVPSLLLHHGSTGDTEDPFRTVGSLAEHIVDLVSASRD
jgi:acyl carrier protein